MKYTFLCRHKRAMRNTFNEVAILFSWHPLLLCHTGIINGTPNCYKFIFLAVWITRKHVHPAIHFTQTVHAPSELLSFVCQCIIHIIITKRSAKRSSSLLKRELNRRNVWFIVVLVFVQWFLINHSYGINQDPQQI